MRGPQNLGWKLADLRIFVTAAGVEDVVSVFRGTILMTTSGTRTSRRNQKTKKC